MPCEGAGEFSAYCSACNSSSGPTFCTACLDLNGEQDSGVYATATGECALCALEGCTVCASPGGECTSCGFAQGLVGGACVACNDQETCDACDGDAAKCSACSPGHFADAAGLCVACVANCTACTDASTCEECTAGTTWDAASGACVPCSDQVRMRWGQGRPPGVGGGLVADQREHRCAALLYLLSLQNCVECASASNCTACDIGWTAQEGACTQWCAAAAGRREWVALGGRGAVQARPSSGCDPSSSRVPPDRPAPPPHLPPLFFRTFSPEGCGTCENDPAACDDESSCLDGYGPADAPNTCTKCATANCTACGGTYKSCTECLPGFRFDAPAEQCQGGSGWVGRQGGARKPWRAARACSSLAGLPTLPACSQSARWSTVSSATLLLDPATFARTATV